MIAELEGLSSMSLAASLSFAGEFDRSLDVATQAVALLDGKLRVAAMAQRAGLLQRAGRNPEALRAFTAALDAAGDTTDHSIVGDLHANRGVLFGRAGEIDAAEADTRRALLLFQSHGWTRRAAEMRRNLASLAVKRGDLVEAFRRFDEADEADSSLGVSVAGVFPARAEALLAAGLSHEALALAERSLEALGADGDVVEEAEALMLVARAALLAGEVERAASAAGAATALFEATARAGWWATAASLRVEARLLIGATDESDVALIDTVIAATNAAGLSTASTEARVIAAELAAVRGDTDAAERHLAATRRGIGLAARCRRDLVEARVLAGVGRPDEALARCAATVEEFAVLTSVLGGTEVRAHIAMHVAAIVDFAVALSVHRGDAELAFTWSERQRASALAVAPVRPPEAAELARDLDHLRAAITELDASTHAGVTDPEVARHCAQLQERVRRRTRHAGRAAGLPGPIEESAAIAEVGLPWVSYVEFEGELAAVRVVDGHASVVRLGPAVAARREAELLMATLTMHLSAVSRGLQRDPAIVLAAAADTAAALVEPVGLPDGPVVLSPSASLHVLPWGLLPVLQSRPFVLAPSVALWRRCRDRPGAVRPSALVVSGPAVPLAADEGAAVAGCHADATVLAGDRATVAAVEDAIRGVDVAHLVCHGSFARDNPMFSSLLLADGPMFVYDFERLAPPPHVVVLSACSAGSHASPTGTEILGLTASLLATGPRAVIAATVPVPDTPSTIALMVELHRALAAGAGPAEALRRARTVDPMIGGAFACHGAD